VPAPCGARDEAVNAILKAPAQLYSRSHFETGRNGSNHHRYGEVKTRLTIDASGDFAKLWGDTHGSQGLPTGSTYPRRMPGSAKIRGYDHPPFPVLRGFDPEGIRRKKKGPQLALEPLNG
jgi:hypothetical protein